MNTTFSERIVYLFLFVISITGAVLSYFHQEYFLNHYVKEDGLIEYGTALIFLIAAAWLTLQLWKTRSGKGKWYIMTSLLIIMAALFVAGEEISWGQRVFNIDTPEYLAERNAQSELNLHNLVVGDVKINKLIFGQLLTASIILYLVLLPVLYQKWETFQRFVHYLFIPVSRYHHAIAYSILLLIVLIIPHGKKWELLEFNLAVLFLMILVNPLNKRIFE
jgi:hypothetical protein